MIKNFQGLSQSIWFKVASAVVALFVFYLVAGFLFPVFMGIALAFALNPLVKGIRKIPFHGGRHLPHAVAIILSFLILGAFLYAIVDFLVLPLFSEVNKLLVSLPPLTAQSDGDWGFFFNQQTKDALPSNLQTLIDSALSLATSHVMSVVQNLITSTFDMALSLIGLVIVPFLTFYFLKDWRTLRAMTINIFSYESQPLVSTILDDIGEVLSAYVRGIFKLSMIAGFCITVGTYLMGVQFSLVLGFIAVVVETVPVLGPILGSIPAVFIAYSQDSSLALKVVIFYIVFYQIDGQYIMPNIMGRSIALHPVLIILGVLVGGKLFGIVGLLFAVPVVAVCKVFYDHLWHMDEDMAIALKKRQ